MTTIMADTTTTTPPTTSDILQPQATAAQTLANRKRDVAIAVPQSFQEQFKLLMQFRTAQRNGAWRNGLGLSAPQYWAAHGTNATAIATTSAKFDAFLESVVPGCTEGDAGVPADYTLTYNADGSVVCNEA